MKEFKTASTNNRVVINPASMKEVKRLRQLIVREMQTHPVGLKILGQEGKSVLDKEVDVSGVLEFIKNVVLGIECSDEFEDALFDCLKHCTYKSTYKIDRDLFEADKCIEAREDYYEIVLACIEENLRPFLKSLVSMWKARLQTNTLFQKLSTIAQQKIE